MMSLNGIHEVASANVNREELRILILFVMLSLIIIPGFDKYTK